MKRQKKINNKNGADHESLDFFKVNSLFLRLDYFTVSQISWSPILTIRNAPSEELKLSVSADKMLLVFPYLGRGHSSDSVLYFH